MFAEAFLWGHAFAEGPFDDLVVRFSGAWRRTDGKGCLHSWLRRGAENGDLEKGSVAVGLQRDCLGELSATHSCCNPAACEIGR